MEDFSELHFMGPITLRRLLVAIAQRLDGIKSAHDKEEQMRRAWLLANFLEGYLDADWRKSMLHEELGAPSDDRWPEDEQLGLG